MRILQVLNKPQRRGAEIFALDLCRGLEALGHVTRIVTLYSAPDGGNILRLRDDDRQLGATTSRFMERLPGWQPGLLGRLLTVIDEFEPDVVQVNGSRTVKYGSLARRCRSSAPWVLVYRSIGTPTDWAGPPLRRLLYRHLVIAQIDGAVAVSEATLASLEEAYQLRVPIRVIPRGVDLERFSPPESRHQLRQRLGTAPERPVILYVGSLSPEKRLDRLQRVASEVTEGLGRPLELWIVGDGPMRREVEARTARAHRDLKVRLFGSREDVASFMVAADLLLLTSDTEGTPGVLLEAGALGVPSVATRVGGTAECVIDGETGLLADPEDEASLARATVRLLEDPGLRKKLGEAAACRVRAHFATSELAGRYVEHYRNVRSRRRELL